MCELFFWFHFHAIKFEIYDYFLVYLNLLSEIDNDELICALQLLICKYKQAVAPFAITMLQRFVTSFFRIISSEDGEDLGSMACLECLNGIILVLETMRHSPEFFDQVDMLILFPISRCLGEEFMEYIREFLKIMSLFASYSTLVSDNLWNLFPLVIKSTMNWAIDHMKCKQIYFL
jgi:hypothetical protein